MPDRLTRTSRRRQLWNIPRGDYEAIAAHIGRNIQRRRQDLDLTQEKLGAMIFVSQDAISDYEVGRRVPSAVRLWQISVALECQPWELWL